MYSGIVIYAAVIVFSIKTVMCSYNVVFILTDDQDLVLNGLVSTRIIYICSFNYICVYNNYVPNYILEGTNEENSKIFG